MTEKSIAKICSVENCNNVHHAKGLCRKHCYGHRDMRYPGLSNDITGKRFGMLLVIKKTSKKGETRSKWLCKCDCGTEKEVIRASLVNGSTSSCGCSRRKYNLPDEFDRKTYRLWHTMIRRCHDNKTNGYRIYSSKGIKVCGRWQGENGFINFLKDMGDRPSDSHSIDRIDNSKGYFKENCRWATSIEQANNRDTNILISLYGEKQTIAEWARLFKMPYYKFHRRIKNRYIL